MKSPNLSIIIPANNAAKLKKTLHKYGLYFNSQKNLNIEIIVVTSNEFQNVYNVSSTYSKIYPFIKTIKTSHITGKGGAVALGFSEAKGSIVGYVDSDGSIPAGEITRLYQYLKESTNVDGVIGNRLGNKISPKRKIFIDLFWMIGRVFFGLSYKDTQCGLKLFTNSAAKEIAKKLINTGYAFDINLLLISRMLNYTLREINVLWNESLSLDLKFLLRTADITKELLALKLLELSDYFKGTTENLIKPSAARRDGKRKLNIVFFAWRDIKHPQMGGSEVYVHEIAKRLAKKHNVTLFTSRPSNFSARDTIDGIKIIRRGGLISVYIHALFTYLFEFKKYTDVIVDVENGLPFFTPLYSTKPKIMILHHVHGTQWFKQFLFPIAAFGYFVEKFVMPFVYRKVPVVTVSPSSLEELRKMGFRDKSVYLAYNATSCPPKYVGINGKSKTPMIAYLGRLKAYKRIEIALNAIKNIIPIYPNLKFVIAGAGDYENKVKSYIKQYGLDNVVDMVGFVPEIEKWHLLKRSWAFVMPSSKEGWGITITEAALCGTPSVGFDVAGVRDSIMHETTGLLAQNEREFRANLLEMLRDPSLRKRLAEQGVEYAKKFSWASSAIVFEKIVESISHNKRQSILSAKTYPWDLSLSLYQL